MPIHRYNLNDFVTIQRQGFFELLEKGIIEEFSKRKSITNINKDLKFQFYPQYYVLTPPEYTPQEAIIKNKSYTCKLFMPAQLINMSTNQKVFKWFYIGNLPLMTKRGHFILNGGTRVIVNQILRSPGIYYQQKLYENYEEKWSQKPDDSYKRFYADLICMRGTWLRIEIDKYKNIWAQTKKGAKIPIYWLLVAMGLSEKKIFKTITSSYRLLGNLSNNLINTNNLNSLNSKNQLLTQPLLPSVRVAKPEEASLLCSSSLPSLRSLRSSLASDSEPLTPFACSLLFGSLRERGNGGKGQASEMAGEKNERGLVNKNENEIKKSKKQIYNYVKNPPEAWQEIFKLVYSITPSNLKTNSMLLKNNSNKIEETSSVNERNKVSSVTFSKKFKNLSEVNFKQENFFDNNLANEGRKWLYNKFMNPRAYDLGKKGRFAFNRKLHLNISPSQTTLTGLDVLYATDYLLKVEKGLFKIDDIDHLKNRRVRTSGELIQIQIAVGVVRLEKTIREKINKSNYNDLIGLPSTSLSLFPRLTGAVGSFTVAHNKPTSVKASQNTLHAASGEAKPRLSYPFTPNPPLPPFASFAERTEERRAGNGQVTGGKGLGESGLTTLAKLHAVGVANGSKDNLPHSGLEEVVKERKKERLCEKGRSKHNSREIEKTNLSVRAIAGDLTKHSQSLRSVQSYQIERTYSKNLKSFDVLINLVNSKAFNSAIREFFGTSPLSQFMDQINPLAELTHKRRLSSMGPGGVTRDTATLAIRGIHPTHYGRICPIETPEGKNTGLVNSMTTYARVNSNGIIESPFYKVYKGHVQKNTGMYYFSAEQEEKIKLAAADIFVSSIGFLPKSFIPVRIAEDFTKISRTQVQFIGVSALQMISIAASLIPFLEHDDANRALMGSNMQRQAVPLVRPERPIVGTGLEARAVSDSGHSILAKYSGLVTYVSSNKIIVQTL